MVIASVTRSFNDLSLTACPVCGRAPSLAPALGWVTTEEEGQIPMPVQEAGAQEVPKLWLTVRRWGGRYQKQVQQAKQAAGGNQPKVGAREGTGVVGSPQTMLGWQGALLGMHKMHLQVLLCHFGAHLCTWFPSLQRGHADDVIQCVEK